MPLQFSLKKLSAIVWLVNGVFATTFLSAAERDAQVTQTSERQVTIAYRLADFKLDTVQVNGASAVRPIFENAISLHAPGVPQLPTRVFVIGVPFGARAEVSVIPGASEELPEIFVPPVPVQERGDDQINWRYTPDPQIYERDTFYPAELARVDPPAQFRQQAIARVQVMSVQYNPVKKLLRIYRELQIVVRFVGGSSSQTQTFSTESSSPAEEEFYQNLLMNYEQAKAFREARPAQLLRSTSPQIEGPLHKFALRQEGIYKIDGQTLTRNGINLADVNPSAIHLYNNGGRELPRNLNAPRPQGLVENAIYVSDGGDGRFDANDFILFYGRGVEGFAFDSTSGAASHYLHRFSYDNFYWLNFGSPNGKRMAERAPLPTSGLTPATNFKDYLFVEEELNPLFESDQNWYGWFFSSTETAQTRRYRVKLADPIADSRAKMKFVFYTPFGPGNNTSRLTVTFEKQDLAELQIFGGNRPQSYNVEKAGGLVNGDNEIALTFRGSNDAAQLYIDYFELDYDRQLRLSDNMLIFNGRTGAGPFAYTLSNADANSLWLFEVSDFSNVARLPNRNWQINAAQVTFADAGSVKNAPRRYIAAIPAAFKSVGTITRDEVSNWRAPQNAADMIVITHEDFLSLNPATGRDEGPLARFVSLRENAKPNDRLEVEVVKIQDVFDEFSAGMYDPTAIRDFLKYAYENWQRRPVIVLLVGDGDYDPKNIINKTSKNWIPTYTTNELDEISNRLTDHWFTYLAGNDEAMDMAIGRIPARSLAEVQAYIDKIIKYETAPTLGAWRNTALFAADDEYGQGAVPASWETVHILDTETLITLHTPKYFDVKKLYLTEFAAVQSASISGIRKPTASEAFLQLVNSGALTVNYAGHGNPTVWAHERLLEQSTDLNRIQNGDRQALWIAATCTFGQFDLLSRQSFGEELVLAPGRGAIAGLFTSRLVYANANATLNQQYYRFLYESKNQISARLGTALVSARLQTGFTENDEKFHVLGDPSLRLAIPPNNANITSITPDTIKALTVMTVRGKVQRNGVDWPDFNGTVRLEALDSRRQVDYQSPGGFSMNYSLPGNALFRGEAPVQNGNFTAQFFVPKDITYGGVAGRLNLYFWNNSFDGNGFRDNLRVGGTAGNLVDRTGPRIAIGFAGVENFSSGGSVSTSPTLRAVISDSLSGVNITGEIGHKITLTLDGRSDEKIDITNLFNYDSGSYTRGAVIYPLTALAEGRHSVELKAWDNLNNSNTATAEFVVLPQDRLVLREVMNYPNPFRRQTSFTFDLNLDAEVRVKIFTLSGRLIRTLEFPNARPGFNMLAWDGRDEDGDELANGVYLYKIIATQQQNDQTLRAEEISKLVVQR